MESAKLNSFFFVGKDPPENPHIVLLVEHQLILLAANVNIVE